jgi:Cytochrome P460
MQAFASRGMASVIIAAVVLCAALGAQSQTAQVKYPEGYRAWTHVKSMVIQKGHPLFEAFGGIHHIYANPSAVESLRAEKAFVDGAVLVFDLLEATTNNNAIVEGPRKVVGVMERDATRFAATGGWGFEGFKGDTRERVVKNASTECFACHKSDQPQDFVFSTWRR